MSQREIIGMNDSDKEEVSNFFDLLVGKSPAEMMELLSQPFEPIISYNSERNFIIYLREDVSYRAQHYDEFLTILWHPYEKRIVGVQIHNARQLASDSLKEI